jgi:hypothetical protein
MIEQGSMQLQAETLEVEMETQLREALPEIQKLSLLGAELI